MAAVGVRSPGQRLAALAEGSNGGVLGGLIRAQAVFQAGKFMGYRIFPGGRTNAAAFGRLGLRPGDLVTAVNGTPLDDPNRANDIMQTLSSAATATVSVQRDGRSQELTLNLETVANQAENASAQGSAAARRSASFGGPLGGSERVLGPPVNVTLPTPPEPGSAEATTIPAEEVPDVPTGEQ
jgi:membrane-associated protease RseP (regulator of RpoE activity)